MLKTSTVKNSRQNGISKEQILNEYNQLNGKIRKVEQKLSVTIDNRILQDYHRLENELTYTDQSMSRIKLRLTNQAESKQKKNLNVDKEKALTI